MRPARENAELVTAGPSLKGRALRLLTMREYSRAELSTRLAAHATPADDLEQVLDALTADGWLSDERAARSLVSSRVEKWGGRRLRQALQTRGVSEEVIAEAMSGLAETEADRAAQVWLRKFGQPPIDPNERARQMRFLLARGFGSSTVSLVLRRAADIVRGDWTQDESGSVKMPERAAPGDCL